jgi:hypothetical protein
VLIGGAMSKKDRRTFQRIAGELVDYLEKTRGAVSVRLETSTDGSQAFRWEAPIRGNRETCLPCRIPVEAFEYFEGVHEWHIQSPESESQQGELFSESVIRRKRTIHHPEKGPQ